MLVSCIGCGQKIEAETLRPMKVMNLVAVSIIVIEHPNQTMCPNCNAPVVASVTSAQVATVMAPVPPEEQKGIVIVPNGSKMTM
jgi:hypothetical protein